MVHLESVRRKYINKKTAPNLIEFAKKCTISNHHYSPAPNTGGGMSGLLNALASQYYFDVRKTNHQSLPLNILGKLGYHKKFYSIIKINYEQLDKLFVNDSFDEKYIPQRQQT